MKFKVSLGDAFAFKAAAAAKQISTASLRAAQQAMAGIAEDSIWKAREMASDRLHSTKQKYIDSLRLDPAGDNVWTLTLDGESAYLEEGYGSFDMKPGLLKSHLGAKELSEYNVKIGAMARGQQGGIKTSREGFRYRSIPFEHKAAPARPDHPLHSTPVQRGQATETTKGALAADLLRLREAFGDKGITKGPSGAPIMGKVYSVTQEQDAPRWNYNDVLGSSQSKLLTDPGIHPIMRGLTKIQYQAGKATRSAYMTWRTVSENPKAAGKFIHPGFSGAHIFPDLEQWAVKTLNEKLREIFGG